MTDGEALDISRLTASETTFVAGEGRDVTDESGAVTLAVDERTEMEYSIRATATAVDSTSYCFRMTDGGSVMDAYNVYPEVKLSTPPPQPLLTQEGYVFENDNDAVQAGTKFTTGKTLSGVRQGESIT